MTKHEICDVLKKHFSDLGFSPGCDKVDDASVGNVRVSNAPAREILGVEFRPLETTLVDMVNAMIASGRVELPAKKN